MKKKWKEYECCVESCLESDVCNLWPRYLWRSHFHQHFSSLKSKNMPKLWPISAKWPKWKVSEKAWSQFYGKTTLTQQQAREHSSRCWKTSERKTLDEFCFSRVSYECNITNIKHSMDDDQLNWHGTSTFFSSKLGYVLALRQMTIWRTFHWNWIKHLKLQNITIIIAKEKKTASRKLRTNQIPITLEILKLGYNQNKPFKYEKETCNQTCSSELEKQLFYLLKRS